MPSDELLGQPRHRSRRRAPATPQNKRVAPARRRQIKQPGVVERGPPQTPPPPHPPPPLHASMIMVVRDEYFGPAGPGDAAPRSPPRTPTRRARETRSPLAPLDPNAVETRTPSKPARTPRQKDPDAVEAFAPPPTSKRAGPRRAASPASRRKPAALNAWLSPAASVFSRTARKARERRRAPPPPKPVECECCYDVVPAHRAVFCAAAEPHAVCDACVQQLVQTRIGEGSAAPLSCISTSCCPAPLKQAGLARALASPLRRQRDAIVARSELAKCDLPDVASCPFCPSLAPSGTQTRLRVPGRCCVRTAATNLAVQRRKNHQRRRSSRRELGSAQVRGAARRAGGSFLRPRGRRGGGERRARRGGRPGVRASALREDARRPRGFDEAIARTRRGVVPTARTRRAAAAARSGSPPPARPSGAGRASRAKRRSSPTCSIDARATRRRRGRRRPTPPPRRSSERAPSAARSSTKTTAATR